MAMSTGLGVMGFSQLVMVAGLSTLNIKSHNSSYSCNWDIRAAEMRLFNVS